MNDLINAMQPASPSRAGLLLRLKGLPTEIICSILDIAYPSATSALIDTSARRQWPAVHPASIPPANGASPFMALPTELRRAIFAESLPSRDAIIDPKCADDPVRKPQYNFDWRNRTSDLMIINETIRDEVAEVVYEERTFVIHVHEGFSHGGIEFLHAGRQPLYFQASISDDRFWKFSSAEKDFGFRRLKKIRIQIYPSPEKGTRHCALNTYFTNLALVRLLDRSGEEKHRITSLNIQFMDPQRTGDEEGRHAIQRAEHYWWDPEKNQPRETSIHGISNIELVLRPFGNLTGCHSVNIEMPSQLPNYAPISVFTRDLKASMTSRNGLMFADDDLEIKIEAARWAMEDYAFSLKHGTKHRDVDNLADENSDKETDSEDDDDEDNGDDSGPGQKRNRSSRSKVSSRKRRSLSEERMTEEEEDIFRALEESRQFAPGAVDDEEEERQIEQAMKASLADHESQNLQLDPRAKAFSLQARYVTTIHTWRVSTPETMGQANADGGTPSPNTLRRLRTRHFLNAAAPPFTPQDNQCWKGKDKAPRDGETAHGSLAASVGNNQQVNVFNGASLPNFYSNPTTYRQQTPNVLAPPFTPSTTSPASVPSYSPGGVPLTESPTYPVAPSQHGSTGVASNWNRFLAPSLYTDGALDGNFPEVNAPRILNDWMNDSTNDNDDEMADAQRGGETGFGPNGASFM